MNWTQTIGVVPIVAVVSGDETTQPWSEYELPSLIKQYSPPSTSADGSPSKSVDLVNKLVVV